MVVVVEKTTDLYADVYVCLIRTDALLCMLSLLLI